MTNGESTGLESADASNQGDAGQLDGRPGPHGYRGEEKAPLEDCTCEWCTALRKHLAAADEAREEGAPGQRQ